jgi:chromatin remodeling complex protein RSC6
VPPFRGDSARSGADLAPAGRVTLFPIDPLLGDHMAEAKRSTAKKSAAKKSAAKKSTAKKSSGGDKGAGQARGGIAQPVTPSEQLAAIVGKDPLSRAEMTKKLWDYIKKNGLQDAQNRRMINADDRLRPIFGKDQVSMFEMTRLVNQHVK